MHVRTFFMFFIFSCSCAMDHLQLAENENLNLTDDYKTEKIGPPHIHPYGNHEVWYMDSEDRKIYESLKIPENNDRQNKADLHVYYVMSSEPTKKLYIFNGDEKHKIPAIQHSSFFKGEHVYMAGSIKLQRKGSETKCIIDMDSGHYNNFANPFYIQSCKMGHFSDEKFEKSPLFSQVGETDVDLRKYKSLEGHFWRFTGADESNKYMQIWQSRAKEVADLLNLGAYGTVQFTLSDESYDDDINNSFGTPYRDVYM